MLPIEEKLYSPFQRKSYIPKFKLGLKLEYEEKIEWEIIDATVNKVRASDGYSVKTFRQLIDEVARVTLNNRRYEMFYRGQNIDIKNNQSKYYSDRKQKSTIYPTICRPEKKDDGTLKYSIKKSQIIKRYDDLDRMIELYSKSRKSHYKEYYYSLFQHYEILPTPLIDITQSLSVATTFALMGSKTGYVYVFGLPYPNQSISYYSDLNIVLIKLQNVVPIQALRPRYQEGYLVGKFPILPTKTNSDDLGNRMIAKFLVDNSDGNFWDSSFQPIPDKVLFPEDDEVAKKLNILKKKLYK